MGACDRPFSLEQLRSPQLSHEAALWLVHRFAKLALASLGLTQAKPKRNLGAVLDLLPGDISVKLKTGSATVGPFFWMAVHRPGILELVT